MFVNELTPDAVADSSPAPLDPSTALANASPEAYAEWQKTGTLPVQKTDDAAPSLTADSTPALPGQATSTDVRPAAASEPATKDKTEQRFQELLKDRAKERERADRLERELAALRTAPIPPPADVKKAESSPATASDPEPDPDDLSKYPDGPYDRKYMRDQAAWVARDVLRAEQAKVAESTKAQQAEARAREKARDWSDRVTAAQAKYPDYDAKAFAPTDIVTGSPIDVWIMESPQGAELLYHLQTHPDEIKRISALPAVHQVRELVLLETSMQPAPAKTITDAPAPPRTLGDRSAGNADAVARALATKDAGSYIDEMNRRELAARSR